MDYIFLSACHRNPVHNIFIFNFFLRFVVHLVHKVHFRLYFVLGEFSWRRKYDVNLNMLSDFFKVVGELMKARKYRYLSLGLSKPP